MTYRNPLDARVRITASRYTPPPNSQASAHARAKETTPMPDSDYDQGARPIDQMEIVNSDRRISVDVADTIRASGEVLAAMLDRSPLAALAAQLSSDSKELELLQIQGQQAGAARRYDNYEKVRDRRYGATLVKRVLTLGFSAGGDMDRAVERALDEYHQLGGGCHAADTLVAATQARLAMLTRVAQSSEAVAGVLLAMATQLLPGGKGTARVGAQREDGEQP